MLSLGHRFDEQKPCSERENEGKRKTFQRKKVKSEREIQIETRKERGLIQTKTTSFQREKETKQERESYKTTWNSEKQRTHGKK